MYNTYKVTFVSTKKYDVSFERTTEIEALNAIHCSILFSKHFKQCKALKVKLIKGEDKFMNINNSGFDDIEKEKGE